MLKLLCQALIYSEKQSKVFIQVSQSRSEPAEVITTIKNKKTGEIYKNEEELKAANVASEDVQRDVLVKMPKLDLFSKTK